MASSVRDGTTEDEDWRISRVRGGEKEREGRGRGRGVGGGESPSSYGGTSTRCGVVVVDRQRVVVRTNASRWRRRRRGGGDGDDDVDDECDGGLEATRLLRLVVVVAVAATALVVATCPIGESGKERALSFVMAPLRARLFASSSSSSSSHRGMAGDDDGGGRRRALLGLVGVRGRGGRAAGGDGDDDDDYDENDYVEHRDPSSSISRPSFVLDRPYATSSYYATTSNVYLLSRMGEARETTDAHRRKRTGAARSTATRLAIVRPFGEFDAMHLPTTFDRWNSLVP